MTNLAILTDEDLMEAYYDDTDDDRANQAFAELDGRYRTAMLLTVTTPGYNRRFIKLYRRPGLDQTAEELVAETLFKAADTKGKPSARWDRSRKLVSSWLYGILHNVVVSHLRRKPSPVRSESDFLSPDGESKGGLETEPGRGPSPEELVQNRLLLEVVEECRRELPTELQELCKLLFDKELKQTEIARIMKLTTPTLTRRKQEACERLRQALRRRGIGADVFS